MNEIIQRIAKRNNIIVFNLSESSNISDGDLLKKIFLKLKIDCHSVSCERLKISSNRPKEKAKPLLLRFVNNEDAHLFLKNKNLLPKGASACFDRTKEQRAKHNKARKLMLQHNKKYPCNRKVIKYINGERTLVDQEPAPVLTDQCDNAMSMNEQNFQSPSAPTVTPSMIDSIIEVDSINNNINNITNKNFNMPSQPTYPTKIVLTNSQVTVHSPPNSNPTSSQSRSRTNSSQNSTKRKRDGPGRPPKSTSPNNTIKNTKGSYKPKNLKSPKVKKPRRT